MWRTTYALTAQKPTWGFTDDAPAQLTSRRILDRLNLTGTRPGGVMSHCPTSHSGPQRTYGGPRKKWAACGRQRLGQGDTDTRERQLAGQWKGLSAHAKENAPLFCFCLTILMILNIQMSLQNYSYLNNASRPLASASVGALPARSCHSHQHTQVHGVPASVGGQPSRILECTHCRAFTQRSSKSYRQGHICQLQIPCCVHHIPCFQNLY